MDDVSSIFSLTAAGGSFDALSVCASSKLQLLHWVPEQRLWNWKITFVFNLSWRPCRQASPQKQAAAIRLFAKRAKARNETISTVNISKFLNRFFSIYKSIKKATGPPQLLSFYNTSAEWYSSYNSLSHTQRPTYITVVFYIKKLKNYIYPLKRRSAGVM